MFDASEYWITVAELKSFEREADKLLSRSEVDEVVHHLAQFPDDGDVIPGTNGLRKLRWKGHGRGKRGGVRIIYYFRDLNLPLYLLTIFGKGETIDLTKSEKNAMCRIVDEIVREHWSKRINPRVVGSLKPSA